MNSQTRSATLYRMVLADHVCPYGVAANELLRDSGYEVDDRLLRTRAEVDAFQADHGVTTTPQIFIDGKRIGGYDELSGCFEQNAAEAEVSG